MFGRSEFLTYICIRIMKNGIINIDRESTTYRTETLTRWISMIQSYELIDPKEEKKLLICCKNGDRDALERLMRGNQRFLLSAARTYSRNGDEIMDLISEGNMALIRAIRNYDPKYNVKFLSFAAWYIRTYMVLYYKNKSLVHRRIEPSLEKYVRDLRNNWVLENASEMPDWEVALSVSEKYNINIRNVERQFRDVNVYYDDDLSSNEITGDSVIERKTCVENAFLDDMDHEELVGKVRELLFGACQNKLEWDIIVYTYGLFGEEQLPDIEICSRCGIEGRQLDYIRRKLFKRLKKYASGKKLRLSKSKFQLPVEEKKVEKPKRKRGRPRKDEK